MDQLTFPYVELFSPSEIVVSGEPPLVLSDNMTLFGMDSLLPGGRVKLQSYTYSLAMLEFIRLQLMEEAEIAPSVDQEDMAFELCGTDRPGQFLAWAANIIHDCWHVPFTIDCRRLKSPVFGRSGMLVIMIENVEYGRDRHPASLPGLAKKSLYLQESLFGLWDWVLGYGPKP